jgi:hypothetical protein
LSDALKTDGPGSILTSSPALLLKEKGVDFVTIEEVNTTIKIFFFVLPEA